MVITPTSSVIVVASVAFSLLQRTLIDHSESGLRYSGQSSLSGTTDLSHVNVNLTLTEAACVASARTMALIAFLIPNLEAGGAERVALTLVRALIERGNEVDLIVMNATGALASEVPAGVHLVELKVPRFRDALWPLIVYLRRRRPAAIQASMWPLTIMAIVARRLSGSRTRLVVSDHTMLSKHYAGNWRALRALEITTRLLYPCADARIVVAEAAASDLMRFSGLKRDSVEVIYNPVFAPEAPILTTAQIERMWKEADGRILTVGSLKGEKNHALLIRSFARVRQRRAAKLMIVGAGPLEAELRRLVASLRVGNDVIFAGYKTNPWPYYASADLFVLSSDYEGYPLVLLEAMRSGLPVVATDCESGPREILDGGRFGRLAPVGDEEGLAGAILAELSDPTPHQALLDRAEELSGPNIVDRYLDLLIGASKPITSGGQGR